MVYRAYYRLWSISYTRLEFPSGTIVVPLLPPCLALGVGGLHYIFMFHSTPQRSTNIMYHMYHREQRTQLNMHGYIMYVCLRMQSLLHSYQYNHRVWYTKEGHHLICRCLTRNSPFGPDSKFNNVFP